MRTIAKPIPQSNRPHEEYHIRLPARHAIKNYFTQLIHLRADQWMSMDTIVANCKKLVAVANYLEGAEDEDTMLYRRAVISAAISKEITNYIDCRM